MIAKKIIIKNIYFIKLTKLTVNSESKTGLFHQDKGLDTNTFILFLRRLKNHRLV